MPSDLSRFGPAAVARGYNTYDERRDWRKRQGRADIFKKMVLPVAAFATGGAALGAMGGGGGFGLGAANTGVWGGAGMTPTAASLAPEIGLGAANTGIWGGVGMTPAVSAPSVVAPITAKAGHSIGSILGSKGAELVAGLGTTLLSGRAASKAQKEANAISERTNAAQLALARDQYGTEQSNILADRADAERRWAAEEAFRAKQFAADEEERLEQRRLRDEREARLAPRRELSRQALMRVGQILGWH